MSETTGGKINLEVESDYQETKDIEGYEDSHQEALEEDKTQRQHWPLEEISDLNEKHARAIASNTHEQGVVDNFEAAKHVIDVAHKSARNATEDGVEHVVTSSVAVAEEASDLMSDGAGTLRKIHDSGNKNPDGSKYVEDEDRYVAEHNARMQEIAGSTIANKFDISGEFSDEPFADDLKTKSVLNAAYAEHVVAIRESKAEADRLADEASVYTADFDETSAALKNEKTSRR